MAGAQHLARLDPGAVLPAPYPPWSWATRSFHWQALPAEVSSDPVALAFHEAGHALVFAALGMPLETIAIRTADSDFPEGVGGLVQFAGRSTDGPRSQDDDAAAARMVPHYTLAIAAGHMAGLAAELILANVSIHGTVLYGWTDTDNAMSFLGLLGLSASGGLGFAQRYATAALTHNWRAVARVAEELLQAGSLSGDRVLELIGELPALPGVASEPAASTETTS